MSRNPVLALEVRSSEVALASIGHDEDVLQVLQIYESGDDDTASLTSSSSDDDEHCVEYESLPTLHPRTSRNFTHAGASDDWSASSDDNYASHSSYEDMDELDFINGLVERSASRPQVRFHNVQIREYAVTIGDHGRDSCPLTLDWTHAAETVHHIDAYERHRSKRRGRAVPRMSLDERRARVQSVCQLSHVKVCELERTMAHRNRALRDVEAYKRAHHRPIHYTMNDHLNRLATWRCKAETVSMAALQDEAIV